MYFMKKIFFISLLTIIVVFSAGCKKKKSDIHFDKDSITVDGTNASTGTFTYKIRFSGCGKDYETSQPISIIQKQNPNYNITLTDYELTIRNYDDTNMTYEVTSIQEPQTFSTNGTIFQHSQKRIILNSTEQYLTIIINNKEAFSQLLLNNTPIIIYNETIIREPQSLITADIVASNEEKPFYIISILTSIIALTFMWWKIK